MVRLTAVILQRDTDEVTRKLLNLGVMDFIDARGNLSPLAARLDELRQQLDGNDISDLRSRIENLMDTAGLALPPAESLDADELGMVDTASVQSELDALGEDIRALREQQKTMQLEINRKTEIRRQAELFDEISGQAPRDSAVEVLTGLVKKSRQEGFALALKPFPSVLRWGEPEDMEYPVMIMYMKRDLDEINKILERFDWQSIDFPPELRGRKDEIVSRLTSEIADLERKQKELQNSVLEVIRAKGSWLSGTWKNLRMTELYMRMQDRFGRTTGTVVITGWIPRNLQTLTEKTIRETTIGRCYLEWTRPDADASVRAETVPVKLEHRPVLKPFQWIVENYSLPRYGTIDPTIFVAVSFLTMFGLMFGDAGHGFVLALVGALLALTQRGKGTRLYDLGRLVFWCGCSALVAGVLFGSYFGYQWFPALWFDYHGIVSGHGGNGLVNDVYDILGITIRFGMIIIGFGIFLNIVNRMRTRNWLHLFFDKGGLLGGWVYAGGVYTAFAFAQSNYKTLPSDIELLVLVLLPAAIFALKAPLETFIKVRQKKTQFRLSMIMDWVMDWVVELLELFSGYLSNTLSFMRIAGLGIAHVSLMSAFFQIAEGVDSPLLRGLILILGNTMVIALEGLSAGVQSLRLNYYEFFSKYFCGSGKVYEPISLRRSH